MGKRRDLADGKAEDLEALEGLAGTDSDGVARKDPLLLRRRRLSARVRSLVFLSPSPYLHKYTHSLLSPARPHSCIHLCIYASIHPSWDC
jgi:hypothetical protein